MNWSTVQEMRDVSNDLFHELISSFKLGARGVF
jgi:hypothetical protein